jgi:hypothetical protein
MKSRSKNVPMPARGPSVKYPEVRELEVGESFDLGNDHVGALRLRAVAYQYGIRTGRAYSVRRAGESWRIWRVK